MQDREDLISFPKDIRDTLQKENFPVDERGYTQVPFEDIFDHLDTNFPLGWSYEVTQAGTCLNDKGETENFVIIKLTLEFVGGKVTRPGASSGTITMAGLICGALKNAALRHFAVGQNIYTKETETGDDIQQMKNIFETPGKSSSSKAQVYGNENHDNTPRPSFKPWDGRVRVKSQTSKFYNMEYREIPESDIADLVKIGNPLAIKEATRRKELQVN